MPKIRLVVRHRRSISFAHFPLASSTGVPPFRAASRFVLAVAVCPTRPAGALNVDLAAPPGQRQIGSCSRPISGRIGRR